MENNTDNCDVHGSVVMHLTLHSRLQSGHQKYIPSAQLNYQAQKYRQKARSSVPIRNRQMAEYIDAVALSRVDGDYIYSTVKLSKPVLKYFDFRGK